MKWHVKYTIKGQYNSGILLKNTKKVEILFKTNPFFMKRLSDVCHDNKDLTPRHNRRPWSSKSRNAKSLEHNRLL